MLNLSRAMSLSPGVKGAARLTVMPMAPPAKTCLMVHPGCVGTAHGGRPVQELRERVRGVDEDSDDSVGRGI